MQEAEERMGGKECWGGGCDVEQNSPFADAQHPWPKGWTHRGLNPGPSACKADALPLRYAPSQNRTCLPNTTPSKDTRPTPTQQDQIKTATTIDINNNTYKNIATKRNKTKNKDQHAKQQQRPTHKTTQKHTLTQQSLISHYSTRRLHTTLTTASIGKWENRKLAIVHAPINR